MRIVTSLVRILGASPIAAALLVGGAFLGAGTTSAGAATASQEFGSRAVAAVIERVEHAYRADDDGFAAADPGYRVRYSNAEQLVIRPRNDQSDPAAWRVRTVEVRRGSRDLLSAAPVPRAVEDGSLAIEHGALRELLENRAEGIEQSWAFATEPAGRGDLRVRVRLEGARLAARDDTGLHFLHAVHEGTRLHYGLATWIDARGVCTPVEADVDGESVLFTVPEALLARSSWPAVLDPILSPEFPISDPVAMPPDVDHVLPDAAWGADGLLTARTRSNPGVVPRRVETAFVTPDGKPSMPGLAFENDTAYPRISFDGTNYLVVYASGVGNANTDAYARRVDADGNLVDGVPNRLSFLGGVSAVATAWGGTHHLVAWAESANSGITHDVRAARVGTDGVVVDVASFAVGVDPLTAGWPSVACDPLKALCLVVWSQRTSGANLIQARMVDLRAEPGSELGALLQLEDGWDPEVIFDGVAFAIAYQAVGSSGTGIRLLRTDDKGAPIDDLPVSPSGSAPTIAWDGTQYLISWLASGNLVGARMSSAGVLLDMSPITLIAATSEAASTAGGGYFFAVGRDHSRYEGIGDNIGDASLRRMAPDGSLPEAGPIDLTPHSNEQTDAAIAFDGLHYLVVWEDLRSLGGPDVYAARVTPRGEVLDPAGIPVGAQPDPQRDPDVDFDGSDFLVVWTDEQGSGPTIRGARIAIDGSIVDVVPAILSGAGADSPAHPAVAWSGTQHLVVWEDFRNKGATANMDVYGARITPSLASLDPAGIGIATELTSGGFQNNEMSPDVASRAGDWLVVWRDVGTTSFDIAGRRVTAGGALAGTAKIEISTATSAQQAPAIVASDTGYLAVWEDLRANPSSDVYAARLSDAGAVLDPAGIAVATGAWLADAPAVGWDGIQYVAAWRDARGVTAAIYGTPVSTAGAVTQLNGVQVGVGFDEDRPALASHGSATTLLVCERFVDDGPFYAPRLHGRFAGDCGDDILGDGEQCDDANTNDGDGCSAICRNEDERTIYGTASGGTIQVVIGGVIAEVTTVAGQSAVEVAMALAEGVMAELALHTQGVGATAIGDRIVIEGVIESASTTDPGLSLAPLPPVPALAPLVRLLAAGVLTLFGSLTLPRALRAAAEGGARRDGQRLATQQARGRNPQETRRQ